MPGSEHLETILCLSLKRLQKWYILEPVIFFLNSFAFMSFPNLFHDLRIWRWYRMNNIFPLSSTSFMTLSSSSTGIIFGLLLPGISSCLTSLHFWTTILNLRSYYLTLKAIPLFPWAFLITASMLLRLLFTRPILSGTLLLVLGDLHSLILYLKEIQNSVNIHFGFWTSRSLSLNSSCMCDHVESNQFLGFFK